MKQNRRHRYSEPLPQHMRNCPHGDQIHDFMYGWGIVDQKNKRLVWLTYRPPTKRQRERAIKQLAKAATQKIVIPSFKKDISALLGPFDLRKILTDNSLKESK